jgi:hypothetical protein
MTMGKRDLLVLLFVITLLIIIGYSVASNSPKKPKIEGMEYSLWKSDVYGCNSNREYLIHFIISNKEKFLRYNQNQMIDILGKPENQTLYNRGQTFFYYYIKYHPSCGEKNALSDSEQIKLEIRFDALNRSKEIYVYNL